MATERLRVSLLALLLATQARAAYAEDWEFIPKTPEEAALAESFGVFPTRVLEVRFFHERVFAGGSATGFTLRSAIPMPYVLVPGIRISDMYSLVRVDLPVVGVRVPGNAMVSGIGDVHMIDGAIKSWDKVAIGGGFGVQLPSATNLLLGTGKLQVGPVAGVSVWLVKDVLSVSALVENLFSIAGYDNRPGINTLFLQPAILLNMPHGTYLVSQPIITFDWRRDGHATVPVNLGFGYALSSRLVMTVQPEWIAIGDGKNDALVRVVMSYVGW